MLLFTFDGPLQSTAFDSPLQSTAFDSLYGPFGSFLQNINIILK